jgi:phosphatidylinositol dimannoside acyltransferase
VSVGSADARAAPAERIPGDGVSLREWFAYLGYAGAAWLAPHLPETTGRRVFGAAARFAHDRLDGVRETVARNQSLVLGEPAGSPLVRSATREAFDLYARYWFDTFRIRRMGDEEFASRFRFDHLERIDEALAGGRGVITALPHMGNWDAAGHAIAVGGYPIAAVAEELRPPKLMELFVRHRRELGMRVVPLVQGGHVVRQLGELLKDNWVVALVADRALSGRGIRAEMFGGPRTLPSGPAMLSLTTGAPLLVCPVSTTDDGWRCAVGRPVEVERTRSLRADAAELTQRMASEFERAISARPPDWHMFQPFDR